MSMRCGWVVAAVIAGLLLAACGSPAATRVVTFEPGGFTALQTVSGDCWTASIAAPRAGAFRCTVGNAIHDPCFAGAADGSVACPQGDPDQKRGLVIRPTRPLPASRGAPSPEHPWRFRLVGGGECGAMTGTILPGHPYGCSLPAGSVYCAPPVRDGDAYITECAALSPERAPNGAPRLAPGKSHRVAVMWI